jgi:phosphoribosylformimino-5-aminoimidazole carboxamide ribotide isomerase
MEEDPAVLRRAVRCLRFHTYTSGWKRNLKLADRLSYLHNVYMFVFPAIDLRNGRCVRLQQGDYDRETVFSEDPVTVARDFVAQGADRIHVVDLDGAKAGRPVNTEVIRRIVDSVTVPVHLGGGIRTSGDIATVFASGVQWAVLGTRALRDPAFVQVMAGEYPGRIVLGLDAKNGYVATDGWTNTSTTKASALAQSVESAPLAWVVYTDIATDGMMAGPNLTQLKEIARATTLPVVASGGVTTLEDVKRVKDAGLAGAIIGRALYEHTLNLTEALAIARA